ncbi:MAG: DUF3095 domain-containing protein [Gammaproteobacteria bacterium]|nr:DUF3095 domain-containing protein [Gammaproteobacteria bacterium]MCP4982794.1 DUF3095 domain-containing protein [Gammaproteobacteria bacterium]
MLPSSGLDNAIRILLGVRELAVARFNLSLRVGGVAVAKIHQHSSVRVRVGKHRLSPGNEIAAFSGWGIVLAESW